MNPLKKLVGSVLISSVAFCSMAHGADYCMAIRGNGESEPAHWGAAAKVIETLGLPKIQAGGSSASITMMLIDAVATNPLVKDADTKDQKVRAALLIKSMHGLVLGAKNIAKLNEVVKFLAPSNESNDSSWTKSTLALVNEVAALHPEQAVQKIAQSQALLKELVEKAKGLGLVTLNGYAPLFEAIAALQSGKLDDQQTKAQSRIAAFYINQLKFAIDNFGSFDASGDDTLFFRPSLINFGQLAEQLGLIAQFYSMNNADQTESQLWSDFVGQCSEPSLGKTWRGLVAEKADCQNLFNKVLKTHFEQTSGTILSHVNQPVGSTIPSLVSTSILTGQSGVDAERALQDYREKLDPTFGKDFSASNPNEVKFGYWGRTDILALVEPALKATSDAKSLKFLNLGQATWKEVLQLSPAEPGLSSIVPFTAANKVRYVSAGGWSDPHPVQILKAAGCKSVVYVTRRGGDSLFIQGVANRLLGLHIDWKLLSSKVGKKEDVVARNENGDLSDMSSDWSMLYNLANLSSSFKSALTQADAVLCTNWDHFRIKEGVADMVEDSYTSPFHIRASGELRSEGLAPLLDANVAAPGCR